MGKPPEESMADYGTTEKEAPAAEKGAAAAAVDTPEKAAGTETETAE